MHLLDAKKNRIELDALPEPPRLEARASRDALASESPLAKTNRAFFGRPVRSIPGVLATAPAPGPPPVAFRERATGLVRTFKHEIAVRFRTGTSEATRTAILDRFGLELRRRNPFVGSQVIVVDRSRARSGDVLLEVANECAALDEVLFATPNFVSQYRRGLAALRAGRLVEAEEALRAAVTLDPGGAGAHKALGVVLLQGGRRDEAATQFAQALRLDPSITDRAMMERVIAGAASTPRP
jgi:tetratricopeptide (TPR) repeat protein